MPIFRILLVLLIAIIGTTQWSLKIDLLAICCIYFTLRFGRITVGLICIAGGLFENLLSSSPMGLRSLSLIVACWVICSVAHIIYREHSTTKFGSVFLGIALCLVLEWVGLHMILTTQSFFYSLRVQIIPIAFFSAVLALFIMPVLDRFLGRGYGRRLVT